MTYGSLPELNFDLAVEWLLRGCTRARGEEFRPKCTREQSRDDDPLTGRTGQRVRGLEGVSHCGEEGRNSSARRPVLLRLEEINDISPKIRVRVREIKLRVLCILFLLFPSLNEHHIFYISIYGVRQCKVDFTTQ